MIEKYEIERLEATPIEGVAERLGLRVVGHKCLCPFHDDSRPSLTFNTYRNRYRCYVCDAHGGVIDLVRNVLGCGFKEACAFLGYQSGCGDSRPTKTLLPIKYQTPSLDTVSPINGDTMPPAPSTIFLGSLSPSAECKKRGVYPPDIEWLSGLVRVRVLNAEARRFLYEERKIDERVVGWCGLSSISESVACWRYGKAFYDAPSLLIPYYDVDGRLKSVQSRYLGCDKEKARFRFPRGSECHVYGLQILRLVRPREPVWITEGASDCWAMLSSGRKAIAIPSATMLKEKDLEALKGLNLHMYPDQDKPGERLYLELRERLPQLVRHQLPSGCKDFGDYWRLNNSLVGCGR